MKIFKPGKRFNVSGVHIRRLREEHGYSQEYLCTKLQLLGLDINQKAISRIECGHRIVPDYELLYFAKVFDVDVKDLL